ncbi:MAG: hypothetical protein ABEJ87_01540 [Candidatus Nanohalobium sp.]
MNKGASSLVAVFIILVISLIAVSWFRANTSAGTGLQEQIVQQSGVDTFNHRFENMKLYLENSLFYAGQKGSNLAANYSGRKWREPEARYWYCRGSPQAATVSQARNATSNFTLAEFNERINEIHGVRDNHIYSVGQVACLETGYQTPTDSSKNNEFEQGLKIESINLSRQNGDLKKSEENVTFAKDILYNRYWFIYSNLKEWVRNSDVENQVKSAMSSVKDQSARSETMCITDGSKCSYPSTFMCRTNHYDWLEKAVRNGLEKEMTQLERNQKYFNESRVSCSVSFNKNRNTDVPYPGFKVTINKGTQATNLSSGPTCGWTGDEEGKGTPKWSYRCTKGWNLDFQAVMDFTVTCKDKKYRMIPNKTRKNLQWKIDMSFKVTESGNDKQYTENACNTLAEPGVSYKPLSLNSCSFSKTAEICQTPVQTVN